MFDLKYTYLFMGIVYLIVWAILFIRRKDTRREMLVMGCIFAPLGVISQIFYAIDWWQPEHLFGVDIESAVVGFAMGGIGGVLTKHILNVQDKHHEPATTKQMVWRFTSLFMLGALFFWVPILVFNLNTFWATLIVSLVLFVVVIAQRRDLLKYALFNGVLWVVLGAMVYGVLNFLTPHWIDSFWIFKNVPEIVIITLPIDDIVYYFGYGCYVFTLWLYWHGYSVEKRDTK